MSLECISDADFKTRVLGSDRVVVVLFSMERDFDIKMSNVLGRIAIQRGEEPKFFIVKLLESPACAQRYGVSAAPQIFLFAGGNVVGRLIGLHPRDAICQVIDSVLTRPVDELPILNVEELGVHVNATAGAWNLVVVSGLITGVVLAIAKGAMGPSGLLLAGLAYGFFIQNSNFRFNLLQKAGAAVIALVVGFYGREILELWAGLYR